MASVSFQEEKRGRSGKVPLSYYNPVIVSGDKPFWKVMPNNAVPKGKGNKDQQIGYWNEQPRYRMVRGTRKDLPSKWHFYYLGTGPHAEAKFRTRTDGVFWVAVQGSKTEPTGLGTRKRNAELVNPEFAIQLPAAIEIQENTVSRGNSRNQSSNRDRSQSGNRSQNDQKQGNQNQKSRSNSQSRKGNQNSNDSAVDIVAAVKQALKELGVTNESNKKGKNSGTTTPKEQRSKSPVRSPTVQKKQLERPPWKRVPNSTEDVTKCFGVRDTYRNFGDADLVRNGIDAKHYPQLAELVPTPAAILFGGEVVTKEVGSDVEITYIYKMKVPKTDKNLAAFLKQVSAYSQPSQAAEVPSQLNPAAVVFQPLAEDEQVEIIDQVYGSFDA
ncbi:nucleocapsid protein [Alphacoronavirus BtMs-AlphaCoV/GS2013]|uniref:Nucleoprotein n=1 Tax=Alphacoronavirus BtMs-AlphaCoV/GS2013 TaxID=1503290 RepID=A0A0U1UZD2_9ALPC|nr:nucleocapsid protein [Alphacoronavirus BtMs-AlphaCoV/GS2013]